MHAHVWYLRGNAFRLLVQGLRKHLETFTHFILSRPNLEPCTRWALLTPLVTGRRLFCLPLCTSVAREKDRRFATFNTKIRGKETVFVDIFSIAGHARRVRQNLPTLDPKDGLIPSQFQVKAFPCWLRSSSRHCDWKPYCFYLYPACTFKGGCTWSDKNRN